MAVNPDFVGRTYPPSGPYAVDAALIAAFAAAVGATDPVHTDAVAARAAGHRDVIAPPTMAVRFSQAAERAYVSCERVVSTEDLGQADLARRRIARWMVHGVVEAPNGAHFTSCVPDYDRDEAFQKEYVTAAKDPEAWERFRSTYLDGDEAAYQAAVQARVAA